MEGDNLDPSALERLFRRGVLSRRQFVEALAALGVTASGLELLLGSGPVARAQTATADYLVLIVLDAFRPDYATLAPMPALNALARTGISYERAWVGQLESETPSGHATISTGAAPRHTGILGFEWRNPANGQEVLDGWPKGVIAGEMERDLQSSGTTSIPLAVKADPNAKVVAISSEKVYAADAMGGWAADYILYHRRTGPHNSQLIPSALENHDPPDGFFRHPNLELTLPAHHFTDWDYLSTMLALTALEEFRPKVLMVNLPGPDVYGHPYGGPATPRVMGQVAAGVDRNIARLVAAYKQAGLYDRTLFVVTADHGMVPNSHYVDDTALKAAVRRAGGQYLFHTGGTAADIYLHNPQRAPQVAAEVLRLPNVAAAYYQMASSGQFAYVPAAGLKIDPALDAAFRALLATFAGPTAPDVVAPFRENTVAGKYPYAHGNHGGLNWGAQHVPLILSGPGVRPGATSQFPARLMDIAPTVLRLMGLTPVAMDGIVLADAMLSPFPNDVSIQSSLAAPLTAQQDPIIAQSSIDIADDQRRGIHPPPSMAARP